jgi:hypothetical protein
MITTIAGGVRPFRVTFKSDADEVTLAGANGDQVSV